MTLWKDSMKRLYRMPEEPYKANFRLGEDTTERTMQQMQQNDQFRRNSALYYLGSIFSFRKLPLSLEYLHPLRGAM